MSLSVAQVAVVAPAVVCLTFLGGAGCRSSSSSKRPEMASAPAGSNVPSAPTVDRSKCNEAGKKVVTGRHQPGQESRRLEVLRDADERRRQQRRGPRLQAGGPEPRRQAGHRHLLRRHAATWSSWRSSTSTSTESSTLTVYYSQGKKVREEMDMNFDQRPDVWKYFEDEKLVRIERDTNNDGRVDEWQYFEGGKLDRIGYDTTGRGKVDRWDRAPEGDDEPGGGGGAGSRAAAAPAGAAARRDRRPSPATSAPRPPRTPARCPAASRRLPSLPLRPPSRQLAPRRRLLDFSVPVRDQRGRRTGASGCSLSLIHRDVVGQRRARVDLARAGDLGRRVARSSPSSARSSRACGRWRT